MAELTLSKIAEDETTITLGWQPVPGAVGYRFQSETLAPKWSHTFDPSRTSAKFSKAGWYRVEALGIEAVGDYPAAPAPSAYQVAQTIAQGATLAGALDWHATPSDVAGTARVEFFIDGQLHGTENISPYHFGGDNQKLDTRTLANGSHTFEVKAHHTDGRVASAIATANVDNAASPPPGGTLLGKAEYEPYASVNSVPLWKDHVQVKAADRMTIVSDPLGQRGKVMRVEVKPGDNNVAGSLTWERADVYASGAAIGGMSEGKIIAWKFGFLLPSNYQGGEHGVIMGHHASGGKNQSPIHITMTGATNELEIRIVGGDPDWTKATKLYIDLGPLSKGAWHEIAVSVLFSPYVSVGRTMVAIDGVTRVNVTSANMYFGDTMYFKQGWYRRADPTTSVFYFDTTFWYTASSVEEALAAARAA